MARIRKTKDNDKYFQRIGQFKPLNAEQSNRILKLIDEIETTSEERSAYLKSAATSFLKVKRLEQMLFKIKEELKS